MGITSDGLAVVLTPNDKIFPARFEPSKSPAGRWSTILIIRPPGLFWRKRRVGMD
nr:Uncharacterised protein [Klebsiella pneumoniae]